MPGPSHFHLGLLVGGLQRDLATTRREMGLVKKRIGSLERTLATMQQRWTQAAMLAGLWLMGTLGNWKVDQVAELLLALLKGR